MLTDEQRRVLVEVAQMFKGTDRRRKVLNAIAGIDASAAPAEGREPDAWIRKDHLRQAQQDPFLCWVEPTHRPGFDLVPMFVATAPTMSEAVRDVLAERRRVVEQEGFTPEHDDEHDAGDLAAAACAYALAAADKLNPHSQGDGNYERDKPPVMWPENWCSTWWKPSTPRRNLVKAVQLTIAEIERIDRAAAKGNDNAQ